MYSGAAGCLYCNHTQPWPQPRLLFATARRSVNNIPPSSDHISEQRKIVAIGRNYADHVKELRNTLPTEPFFFLKPTTSYLPSGGIIEIPQGITAHHEGAFP
jgi:2-keto-4-pentenoate hydratase/2-oxohepta-3-ene-1,7-dioic acid hydratase in catechol pathway